MNRYTAPLAIGILIILIAVGIWLALFYKPSPIKEAERNLFEGARLLVPTSGFSVTLENPNSGIFTAKDGEAVVIFDSGMAYQLRSGSHLVTYAIEEGGQKTTYLGLLKNSDEGLRQTSWVLLGSGVTAVTPNERDHDIFVRYQNSSGAPSLAALTALHDFLVMYLRMENAAIGDVYIDQPKPFTHVTAGELAVTGLVKQDWLVNGKAALRLFDYQRKEVAAAVLQTTGAPDETGAIPVAGTIEVPEAKASMFLRVERPGGDGFLEVELYQN